MEAKHAVKSLQSKLDMIANASAELNSSSFNSTNAAPTGFLGFTPMGLLDLILSYLRTGLSPLRGEHYSPVVDYVILFALCLLLALLLFGAGYGVTVLLDPTPKCPSMPPQPSNVNLHVHRDGSTLEQMQDLVHQNFVELIGAEMARRDQQQNTRDGRMEQRLLATEEGQKALQNGLTKLLEQQSTQFASMDSRMASIISHVALISARLDSVDTNFHTVNGRFDSVDTSLNAVYERFDDVEEGFSTVNTRLDTVNSSVSSLSTRLDTTDEHLESVHRRIDPVIERLDDIDTSVYSLHTRHDTTNECLESVEQRFNPVIERFEMVDEHLDAIDNCVAPFDKRLSSIEGRFDPLETHLQNIDERLESVDERMDSVDEQVHATDCHVKSVSNAIDFMGERLDTVDKRLENLEQSKCQCPCVGKKCSAADQNDIGNIFLSAAHRGGGFGTGPASNDGSISSAGGCPPYFNPGGASSGPVFGTHSRPSSASSNNASNPPPGMGPRGSLKDYGRNAPGRGYQPNPWNAGPHRANPGPRPIPGGGRTNKWTPLGGVQGPPGPGTPPGGGSAQQPQNPPPPPPQQPPENGHGQGGGSGGDGGPSGGVS